MCIRDAESRSPIWATSAWSDSDPRSIYPSYGCGTQPDRSNCTEGCNSGIEIAGGGGRQGTRKEGRADLEEGAGDDEEQTNQEVASVREAPPAFQQRRIGKRPDAIAHLQ